MDISLCIIIFFNLGFLLCNPYSLHIGRSLLADNYKTFAVKLTKLTLMFTYCINLIQIKKYIFMYSSVNEFLYIQLMHRDYRYVSYMRTEFYNI